jgi:hypothetical protein
MKQTKIAIITIFILVLVLTLALSTKNSESTKSTPIPVVVRPMNDTVFWSIISNFAWQTKDEKLIIQPAIDILSKFPTEDIYKFNDILSEKLYLLDGPSFASNFADISRNQYLSPDMFLYYRCYAVAGGQKSFNKVISDPKQMSTKGTFEGLLYIASYAYEKKTGKDGFEFRTKFNYETYGNKKAWDIK